MPAERFDAWMATLEARHMAELKFAEVSRSLRALSSAYVERRGTLSQGGALSGAGKRAAFALFFGPLHFLLVRHIVHSLPGATAPRSGLTDLGCGTGAAGAAWASACDTPPTMAGIDRHPWAADEARRTYRAFGLPGGARVGDAARSALDRRSGVIAAFAVNEMDPERRQVLLRSLLAHAVGGGAPVLIVEPLAGFVAPWWKEWQQAFEAAGGRADEWRLRTELPTIVAKLDRAAGLNHREITGRSLYLLVASR